MSTYAARLPGCLHRLHRDTAYPVAAYVEGLLHSLSNRRTHYSGSSHYLKTQQGTRPGLSRHHPYLWLWTPPC